MRSILFSLLIALTLGCADNTNGSKAPTERVKAEGPDKTEKRTVSQFSRIAAAGNFNIQIRIGDSASIELRGKETALPHIETIVSGETLDIRIREGVRLEGDADFTVLITAPTISSIMLTGNGDIKVDGSLKNTSAIQLSLTGNGNLSAEVETPSVTAALEGNGEMELRGKTQTLSASLNGNGDLKAGNLLSENVNIRVTGNGSAEVHASKALDANITGAGDVEYRGTPPSVKQTIAGGGAVRRGG